MGTRIARGKTHAGEREQHHTGGQQGKNERERHRIQENSRPAGSAPVGALP